MKNSLVPHDGNDGTGGGVRAAEPQRGAATREADPWGEVRDFVTLSVEAEDDDEPGAASAVVAIAWQFSQMRASLAC